MPRPVVMKSYIETILTIIYSNLVEYASLTNALTSNLYTRFALDIDLSLKKKKAFTPVKSIPEAHMLMV